jgi:hypothetical protein
LPPTAYTWRPKLVRISRNANTTTSAVTSGTTHGTPWMTIGAFGRWRSWLSRYTAISTTTPSPTTLAAQTDIAGTGSPAFLRVRIAQNVPAAKPPTTMSANSQPSPTAMFLFMTDRIASLRIGIVPPSPMISSIAPCRPRK